MKSGLAKSFRSDGSLSLELPYESNQREGKAILYNLYEEPNGYRWYKNNSLVASESFNRFDQNGLKICYIYIVHCMHAWYTYMYIMPSCARASHMVYLVSYAKTIIYGKDPGWRARPKTSSTSILIDRYTAGVRTRPGLAQTS